MAYVIVITRTFYNEPDRQSVYWGDGWGAQRFKTPEAAKSVIEEIDSGRYDLSYNEADRPTYEVCKESELPAHLVRQLEEL